MLMGKYIMIKALGGHYNVLHFNTNALNYSCQTSLYSKTNGGFRETYDSTRLE